MSFEMTFPFASKPGIAFATPPASPARPESFAVANDLANTVTVACVGLKLAVSVGVKITFWLEEPAMGITVPSSKEKLPGTLAEPPERVDVASA